MRDPAERHRPRKRFGQHFLHDRGVVARLIAAIAPRAEDHLVEIGPGEGALTEALLGRSASLDLIELDRDLAAALAARLAAHTGVHVHQADALAFDFAALASPAHGGRRLRVVGNLPYNVSTPLLFHLLDQLHAIEDMHFMLQREVVTRLAAHPGEAGYGRLGVMIGLRCHCEKLFTVAPGAFRPPPRVTSAVVRLRPRAAPAAEVASQDVFTRLVARLFSQRRKTVRNGLRGVLEERELRALGIDPGARPERLDIAQFAALANAVHARGAAL
ncbi:MAG: 16S rRNA (adenine(1518)-N(6)/adenine(1519)-N(6))-dimethyltransferase RsmA [Gammaproteobacteria bacterium]|nr:16S rRNA (adenine(1518)-N(6)/adenine(1519)-N(6))-dimethyltransferase RsmA [Gammaproteobacteria bacterium]